MLVQMVNLCAVAGRWGNVQAGWGVSRFGKSWMKSAQTPPSFSPYARLQYSLWILIWSWPKQRSQENPVYYAVRARGIASLLRVANSRGIECPVRLKRCWVYWKIRTNSRSFRKLSAFPGRDADWCPGNSNPSYSLLSARTGGAKEKPLYNKHRICLRLRTARDPATPSTDGVCCTSGTADSIPPGLTGGSPGAHVGGAAGRQKRAHRAGVSAPEQMWDCRSHAVV